MTGEESAQELRDDVARLALRKAAAFDAFTAWLGEQVEVEWTGTMTPEWVTSTLRAKLTNYIDDARLLRAGKPRPWLRRQGW